MFFFVSILHLWHSGVTYLTLVANDAKIVHFTFYVYFPGALGPRCFWGSWWGHSLDTPLCGADRERSGSENWMSGSGAVSGGYRKRRERWPEISTAPAPAPLTITCSLLVIIPSSRIRQMALRVWLFSIFSFTRKTCTKSQKQRWRFHDVGRVIKVLLFLATSL